MSRTPVFSSPLLVGFDGVEKTLERIGRGSDGYPPYNIERVPLSGADAGMGSHAIRITLAVAGFRSEDLEITTEDNQLTIRGSQTEARDREYLHRGIAARQFQKSFLFADGMRIMGAQLKNGLLMIDLVKPEPERTVKRIQIVAQD